MKPQFALATCALLAACGGGGGGSTSGKPLPDFSDDPAAALAEYEELHEELRLDAESQFHTAFIGGEFPTSGTARFGGTWQNVLDAAGTPTVLYGLADVTADYEGKTASGSVGSVVGQIGGGPAASYDGEIAITDGQIGKTSATTAQNDIFFDYEGTLVGNGQTIELSGSNEMGKFLQTPITGFEATGTSTATINGVSVTDDMSVYTVVVP